LILLAKFPERGGSEGGREGGKRIVNPMLQAIKE
jgi:hypothetical protein